MLEVAGEALKLSRTVPWDTLCRLRSMRILLRAGGRRAASLLPDPPDRYRTVFQSRCTPAVNDRRPGLRPIASPMVSMSRVSKHYVAGQRLPKSCHNATFDTAVTHSTHGLTGCPLCYSP